MRSTQFFFFRSFGPDQALHSFIAGETDNTTFDQVQSRFAVKVAELPDEIDLTAYMPKPGVKEKYDD